MTQTYSTEAILLTVRDCGAADRMVTLFSPTFGKIAATAFGARRPKSKLAGCLQPFAQVDLLLARGKEYDTIKQCEMRNSFRGLREDLERMAYGLLITEIVSEMWPEREADPVTYQLLLKVLTTMSARNPRLTALAGAWQLLTLAGLGPDWTKCIVCGKIPAYPAYFDITAGGLVGDCCRRGQPGNFPAQVAKLLQQLITLEWDNPGQFSVTKQALAAAEKLLREYLLYQLEKPLKSLAFIDELAARG